MNAFYLWGARSNFDKLRDYHKNNKIYEGKTKKRK